MGAEVFSEPRRPGEAAVPAVTASGGEIIYFIDGSDALGEIWSKEFDLASTSTTGAGLTRIDHLAQTTRYDEMLSLLLFYTAIFDVSRSGMVDVADPGGLVRSQAIHAADGRFRVTINGRKAAKPLPATS